MATAYDCKFIETSVGINHNVDELLVGLLSQIRLKLENPEKSRWVNRHKNEFNWIHYEVDSLNWLPVISNNCFVVIDIEFEMQMKIFTFFVYRDLFRKRSYRKSKRRACSPLGSACLSGNGGTNPSTPVSATTNNLGCNEFNTPPSSAQSR